VTPQQQRAAEARLALGLSREEFAAELGVSARAVYSWEQKQKWSRNPSKAALRLMDRLLEFERMRQILNAPQTGPGGTVEKQDRGN
jgi:DNA-binding transcriptional regulator YiaG